MSIVTTDSALKILINYNPWWKTNSVPEMFLKPIKRVVFDEVKETLLKKDIRRFIILSGARRVGKTTILYQEIDQLIKQSINPKNILYVSFDNPILKFFNINEIVELYINTFSVTDEIYLFFDEIQYAENWDVWLKTLYDMNPYMRLVATESTSPSIEKGVAESGTGRWITIKVPTLSFYEYCKLLNINIDLNNELNIDDIFEYSNKEMADLSLKFEKLLKAFNRYIIICGFPELINTDDEIYAQKILREDIVDKVLKRDIPELFNIRNISVLEKIFIYLCLNTSSLLNLSTVAKEFEGISKTTIQEYIGYLEDANLIYLSSPIDAKGKNILKSQSKVYISDSTIRNAVLMENDIIADNTQMGYIIETLVFRHVLNVYGKYDKLGYCRESRNDDKEIDLVVSNINYNRYIEVKYKNSGKANVKRDNSFYKIGEKNDKYYIITKDLLDLEVIETMNGKKILKIPAIIYLYLISMKEYN